MTMTVAELRQWAVDNGIYFGWEPDSDGDHSYLEQGNSVETCEVCYAYEYQECGNCINVLASLGCIDNADDSYRRMVEADLAYEIRAERLGR